MSELYRLGPRAALSFFALALAFGPPAFAQTFVRDEAASAVVRDLFFGALAWADYDGDGDPDLAVTGSDYDYAANRFIVYGEVYRNDGGTLVLDAAASAVVADVMNGALAWADVDGDGDLDLALTGSVVEYDTSEDIFFGEVYRNDGGVLVRDDANSAVVADVSDGELAWADVDGDGDPDLALTGYSEGESGYPGTFFGEVYRNDGGTLVRDDANSAVVADAVRGGLAWADYDGDGDPDLALTGGQTSDDVVGEVYRNDEGTLVRDDANSAVVADVYNGGLAWADVDGDGDPDLVVTGFYYDSSNNPVYVGEVYRNDGGMLVRHDANSAVVADVSDGELAWGDYDGDGDPDLVLTSAGGEVYRNDGGTLVRDEAAGASIPEVSDSALAWADYDSDGDDDLTLLGRNFEGGVVRTFGEVFRYGAAAPGAPPVADAGPNQSITSATLYSSVPLDGSGSSDPDGDPLGYTWREDGEVVATGASPFVILKNGTHVLTLTVTDPSGLTDTDEVTITLTPILDLTLRPVPVSRPFIRVDPGESFLLNFNLDNRDITRRGGDGWFVVADSTGATVYESAPAAYSLRRERDRSWRLLVEVPAWAAAGPYTVVGYVGSYPGEVFDADSLAFRVRDRSGVASAEGRATAAAWAVLDAETGAARAAWTDEAGGEALDAAFALGAPYPNPAAGLVAVPYAVVEAGVVRLAVYDVLGREVARLADGVAEAGAHTARFETGALPVGAYVVRLEAGGAVATARLVVAR